uniref:Immunoglobulin domain-containing protein n=1 Tax=Cyclopterus lumpus TaxID=8103 RepID=A0A8C2WM77_CYCLU
MVSLGMLWSPGVTRHLLYAAGVCAEASAVLEVSGHVGAEVSIHCSGSWTTDNSSERHNMYFCKGVCSKENILIQTANGRFSLYDNTTGAFVIVRLDNLTSEDSGTYRCGVDVDLPPDQFSFIELNVSRGTVCHVKAQVLCVDCLYAAGWGLTFHLSLFMTAAMCMAAMLFICLFTLCLWLVVQHRRPGPRQDREVGLNL